MVLFWCRTKQAQLRALSIQFIRCYFQTHGSSSVIQEAKFGALNGQSLTFHRCRSELGNYVRFFAAPVQVKPKYEKEDKGRPRMNEEISSQYVRLVTDGGHGVVSRREALERARAHNVDLVQVQSDGDPPVCKLMDYKKETYLRQVKEKERTKKKSDLVLRKGGLKEVRINHKIDKHDMQTKADAVRRLAERGYRIKCMAVAVGSEKLEEQQKQDLGGLLSRLSALIDEFSLVESGPIVEPKQAYIVVRHVKFGPLKKGPGKKKLLAISNANTSTQSLENDQSLDESDSETETETEESIKFESHSPDDFDTSKKKPHESTVKFAPETSNQDRTGSENRYAATRQTNPSGHGSDNRYATMRPTNGSGPGPRRRFEHESQSQSQGKSYGMFGAPKMNDDPHTESRPVEVNRYKKGPRPQVPPSDNRGGRGDFSRENTNTSTSTNPGFIREKQAGFRR